MTLEDQIAGLGVVRIGTNDYKTVVKKLKGLLGNINVETEELRIHPGKSLSSTLDTFLHEIVHAIIWERHILDFLIISKKVREDFEEKLTTLLGSGLAMVLLTNPKLCKLIGGLADEQPI